MTVDACAEGVNAHVDDDETQRACGPGESRCIDVGVWIPSSQ